MATNTYTCQLQVDFDEAKPSHYYGFYISGSTSADVTDFVSSSHRERYIAAIAKLLPGYAFVHRIAAFNALAESGGDEGDKEWGSRLLEKELDEYFNEFFNDGDEMEGHRDYLWDILSEMCTWYTGNEDEFIYPAFAVEIAPVREVQVDADKKFERCVVSQEEYSFAIGWVGRQACYFAVTPLPNSMYEFAFRYGENRANLLVSVLTDNLHVGLHAALSPPAGDID